jgi:hypothetical protein
MASFSPSFLSFLYYLLRTPSSPRHENTKSRFPDMNFVLLSCFMSAGRRVKGLTKMLPSYSILRILSKLVRMLKSNQPLEAIWTYFNCTFLDVKILSSHEVIRHWQMYV